ncbi:hypothetical protein [Bryobacter aggregatus]|uniref:hypothetical protein n=1 Tax=Bryobacter aggregatus TaxID=360054 RepID=UPI0012BB185C|nr:hypothetical protein [Bryobacter aggregatus]
MAIAPQKLNALAPEDRLAYQTRINRVQNRLKRLRRSALAYSTALSSRQWQLNNPSIS